MADMAHEAVSNYQENLRQLRNGLLTAADGRKVIRLNISNGHVWAIIEGERNPVKIGPIWEGSLEDLLWVDAGGSPNLD